MAGNTIGKAFKVTTWGESHGLALGAVIDGCPPHIELSEEYIQEEMERRRPGRSKLTSPRKEPDEVLILSGVFEGKTTGTPISLIIYNKDVDSSKYEQLKDTFRPGHADYTYFKKYGIRDYRGGGRAAARETVARVAAGAVAKKVLEMEGIYVFAYTLELGGIRAQVIDFQEIDKNELFCPDKKAAKDMKRRIREVKQQEDSIGGIVEIMAKGCPAGLGESVFDKLDAEIAKALMSIGAVKGVEIGAGFAAAQMLGSFNNDEITPEGFKSNNAGGILGGISNGDNIVARVAVKPIPSIGIEQDTVDTDMKPTTISVKGRHDISAIPRIVPVCEAMVRLVLVDHLLRQRTLI